MAGRIRSVKPEWLEDELLVDCSSDARVLSISLIVLADDFGNGRGGLVYLTSRAFPGKPRETLVNALEELVRIRYVVMYEADGQRYFHIRNWAKHQRVDHPGKPLVPGPTALSRDSRETLDSSPETLKPDRDRDRDMDQRPTTTTPVAAAAKVPCPKDLALTPDQAGMLETSGIPAYAQAASSAKFVGKALADPGDLRTLVAWRKCLSSAISGDWNNPNTRPKHPDEQPRAVTRGISGGPSAEWPAEADLSLREAIRGGAHGENLKSKLLAGELDAPLARRLIRDGAAEQRQLEERRATEAETPVDPAEHAARLAKALGGEWGQKLARAAGGMAPGRLRGAVEHIEKKRPAAAGGLVAGALAEAGRAH